MSRGAQYRGNQAFEDLSLQVPALVEHQLNAGTHGLEDGLFQELRKEAVPA